MAVVLRQSRVLQLLNLTPLIDVVFQLLIFFLVATQFAEEDRFLEMKLPTASQAQPMIDKPDDLELSIDAGGNYLTMGGERLTLEQMKATLQEAALNHPLNQTVVIRADRSCPWNSVAQAMSLCYAAGLRDVKTSVAGSQP